MVSFRPISVSNLSDAYSLVSLGFNLDSARSERLYQLIVKNNSAENYFGYSLYVNGVIVGAIFSPIQGALDDQLGVSLILFYVLPAYRGVNAIQFVSAAIRDMKMRFSFISDYTASREVDLILKSLRFSYMDITYVTGNPWGTVLSVLRMTFSKYRFVCLNIVDSVCMDGVTYKPSPATKLLTVHIPTQNKTVKLFGFWATRKKYLKYFHVIATDSETALLENLSDIQAALLLNWRALLLVDATSKSLNRLRPMQVKSLKIPCRYLFWSNSSSQVRVLALGSELPELS